MNKKGNDRDNKDNSFHIFLFPFKWDYIACEKNFEECDFESRINLDAIGNILTNPGSGWHRKQFNTDTASSYNAFVYYYDFVQDALFDRGQNKNAVLQQYAYNITGETRYKIALESGQNYDFQVEKILLDIYATGVAVLSFHLKNTAYANFNDILYINEFGRRIYPQFLSEDGENPLTGSTKNAFLANSLELVIDNDRKFTENFSYFDDLLFFAPVINPDTKIDDTDVSTILDLIDTLDKKFKDFFPQASLSFGLSITYYKFPMSEALDQARDLLLDKAKKYKDKAGNEKNTLAYKILKHSGSYFGAIQEISPVVIHADGHYYHPAPLDLGLQYRPDEGKTYRNLPGEMGQDGIPYMDGFDPKNRDTQKLIADDVCKPPLTYIDKYGQDMPEIRNWKRKLPNE